jgi:hypothetical protein
MHEGEPARRIVRWQTNPRKTWVCSSEGKDEVQRRVGRLDDIPVRSDDGWKPKRYLLVFQAGTRGGHTSTLVGRAAEWHLQRSKFSAGRLS